MRTSGRVETQYRSRYRYADRPSKRWNLRFDRLRRPGARRRSVGLRRLRSPRLRGGRPSRPRGRRDRASQRDRDLETRRARPRAGAQSMSGRRRSRRTRSRFRSRTRSRCFAERDRAMEQVEASASAAARWTSSDRRSMVRLERGLATSIRRSSTPARASRRWRSTTARCRSVRYPGSFRGHFAAAGYELVEEMDLAGNAQRDRRGGRRAPARARVSRDARRRSCSTVTR